MGKPQTEIIESRTTETEQKSIAVETQQQNVEEIKS